MCEEVSPHHTRIIKRASTEARLIIVLLHQHHQIFASRPELLRIGDTQDVLFVGILRQCIAGLRMSCQYLGRTAIETYLFINTDVYLGKVVTIDF